MTLFDSKNLASTVDGFGWILRPYKNHFGIFSVLLVFVAVLSVWLVSMMSYQFKQRYFNELSGIYPPIFINKRAETNANIDWDEVQKNVHGIDSVRKEHFGQLIDVCIDDNKGVGFRPVRTGIRTLADETLTEQTAKYGTGSDTDITGQGLWMSSALYEVVFGEPYTGNNSAKTITLIARIKRRNMEFVNPKTCQTNGRRIDLPIIKVLPLASETRWLVLRKTDVPKLNVAKQLTWITSVYTASIGNKERAIYQAIAEQTMVTKAQDNPFMMSPVKYWIDELPTELQIQLDKIETRFYLFLLLTFVMVLSFMINLYLMTQKNLQESFYLLRFYGVNKNRFFVQIAIVLILFWLCQYGAGFFAAWGLLRLAQPGLFANFAPLDYVLGATTSFSWVVAVVTVAFPMLYVYYHFWTKAHNCHWKGTQC